MNRTDRNAFSLVEILAVLVILALLAGVAAYRSHAAARRTALAETAARVAEFDRQTRLLARAHDRPLRVLIDLGAGRLRREDVLTGREMGAPLALTDGFRIARFLFRRETAETGTVSFRCSSHGLTPTYALALEGPDGRKTWLLAAGLGGDVTVFDDDVEKDSNARDAGKGSTGEAKVRAILDAAI
ncbi:MAG: prepilin-type N-terminal cleavage/methylation domain-containing protein [Planctomycetota bacterium]|nr:prepilin-type N-terminal cleavage/methylation domain-containing protein [Planctomycetota bacterium]